MYANDQPDGWGLRSHAANRPHAHCCCELSEDARSDEGKRSAPCPMSRINESGDRPKYHGWRSRARPTEKMLGAVNGRRGVSTRSICLLQPGRGVEVP